ncbi:MAG TPA: hypothetical protein VGD99_17595, partial [Anaerolineae bacterium]
LLKCNRNLSFGQNRKLEIRSSAILTYLEETPPFSHFAPFLEPASYELTPNRWANSVKPVSRSS